MENPIFIGPGEILLEEYLKPMGISQAMARAIGVSPRATNEIVHARRSITPAMSSDFGAFFRAVAWKFWHGIQVEAISQAGQWRID